MLYEIVMCPQGSHGWGPRRGRLQWETGSQPDPGLHVAARLVAILAEISSAGILDRTHPPPERIRYGFNRAGRPRSARVNGNDALLERPLPHSENSVPAAVRL